MIHGRYLGPSIFFNVVHLACIQALDLGERTIFEGHATEHKDLPTVPVIEDSVIGTCLLHSLERD